MKTLTEIIDFYGSDKNLSQYTPFYEVYFEPYRMQKISILEIGIGTIKPNVHSSMEATQIKNYKPGASLRSWQEYFPNVMVYGGDVQDDTQFEDERIKTFLFDSTDDNECNETLKDLSFKIIIDDGLHASEAQISTFNNLFKRVEDGGLYIIEDINSNGIREYISNKFKEENLFKAPAGNLIIIFKR